MRIGLDISRAVGQRTGVGQYAWELMTALARIDEESEYRLYTFFYDCFPDNWKDISYPRQHNVALNELRSSYRSILKRWTNGEDKENLLGDVDIVHSTAYTSPLLHRSKLVVTVHDMTCYVYPQFHTQENYDFVNQNLHWASRRAAKVIADSHQTKADIQRYLHVPEEKIEVIHLGVSDRFRPDVSAEQVEGVKHHYGIEDEYILAVGSIEPRKNLGRLLVVYRMLVEHLGIAHKLVLLGGAGWRNTSFYELLDCLGVQGRVVFTGYVPDDDVRALYSGACFLAFPSLYEGFGLPILEAMACGTPVLTSNCSSMPEAAGDAALLVDPLDEWDLYQGMERMVLDEELRGELRRRGLQRAKRFSWEKTAAQTLRVYEEIDGPTSLSTIFS